jgi:uncharacterized protein with von Willebrand factor type A (vWA) domain
MVTRKRKNMHEDENTGTATASHEEAEGGERNGYQADTATPGNGDGQAVKPKIRRVESKSDRFRRLAVKRVNVALKMIGRVAALGSKASYDYSQEQAAKIVRVLQEAVTTVKVRLEATNVREDRFSL